MLEVFGIAFSIMGLVSSILSHGCSNFTGVIVVILSTPVHANEGLQLPSIASTLAYSIPAGPVGLVWGWFLASLFIFIVGLAMSDLASSVSCLFPPKSVSGRPKLPKWDTVSDSFSLLPLLSQVPAMPIQVLTIL